MKRYRPNDCSLQSEVLAAIVRCEQSDKKATVGQVQSHLINVKMTRVAVQRVIDDLYTWGLIVRLDFNWRPNVPSACYILSQEEEAWNLCMAMITYNFDLAPYFQSHTNPDLHSEVADER